jgi:hypothetical protein
MRKIGENPQIHQTATHEFLELLTLTTTIIPNREDGERTKDPEDILPKPRMRQAHPAQGHPVQGRKGVSIRPGKASVRSEAVRIRRTDQASLPQESQDHQEDCSPTRMLSVQGKEAAPAEAMQTLRTRVRFPSSIATHPRLFLRRSVLT